MLVPWRVILHNSFFPFDLKAIFLEVVAAGNGTKLERKTQYQPPEKLQIQRLNEKCRNIAQLVNFLILRALVRNQIMVP